ncbi:MAG: transposase [Anaerolineales bacterium]|nr:transposase [Anaerolineales bacterium]
MCPKAGTIMQPGEGLEERFNSASYQAFLLSLLAQFSGPILLIQDGAKYHTSQATREFFEQHTDRLIVYQLPSYSPDYNPIEYLWKKVKTKATHNRYFEEFAKLIRSVDDALAVLATQVDEIKRLMGVYTKHMAEPHTNLTLSSPNMQTPANSYSQIFLHPTFLNRYDSNHILQ